MSTSKHPFRAKALAEAKRMIEALDEATGSAPITAELIYATLALAFERGAEWGFERGKGKERR